MKKLMTAIAMIMAVKSNAQTHLVLGAPETIEYARTNSILAEANRKASIEAFKGLRSPANRLWLKQAHDSAKSWREFEAANRRAEKSQRIVADAVIRVTPPEAVAAAVKRPDSAEPEKK
jgi:hypothetical protein